MPTWSTIRDRRLKAGDGGAEAAGDRASPSGPAGPDADGDRGRRSAATVGRSLSTVAERGMAGLATLGLTSQRIQRGLAAVGLADVVAERIPAGVARAGAEQVDFERSGAYARSRIECGVRVNLQGREPSGVVPESAYEAVRSDLIDALSSVTTPDGDPVFEDVARREAYFHGPAADAAVDVVTVPADFDQFLSTTLAGDRFGPPSEPYNHKREGVFAAAGAAVDGDAVPADASLLDVAPTVLATFDVPADERMDGTALPVVADAGERSYPPFERTASRGRADDAVAQRLENLGYIE
jgi:hypothetical protein